MAFLQTHFQFNRGVSTSCAQGNGITPVMHTYTSSTDTLATISGANYFPPYCGADVETIFPVDLLLIVGSNGTALVNLISVNPVVLGANLLSSSTSLLMGAPIDAVDNNAARISGNTLQIEFATSSRPGSVSTDNQTFAGTKAFNNGVNVFGPGLATQNISAGGALPINIGVSTSTQVNVLKPMVASGVISANAGIQVGSSSVMTLFQETSGAISWQGPWASTKAGFFRAQRFDNVVYLTISAVPPAAANNSNLITPTSPVVPPTFAPIVTSITHPLFITSNSAVAIGNIQIFSNGFIIIAADFNSAPFSASGNAGFNNFSCSYVV